MATATPLSSPDWKATENELICFESRVVLSLMDYGIQGRGPLVDATNRLKGTLFTVLAVLGWLIF
jgi:hypothetical protein